MGTIGEFSSNTSSFELLVHLYDRIETGELRTFDSIKEAVAELPEKARAPAILRRAFDLHRRLYWGFFRDLSPESYPDIWQRLVLPDQEISGCGVLKRLVAIQDIYFGLLDIHGYTRFCQENRRNLSMVDLLDRMIQEDIFGLCAKAGVLCRRAHGDEILLMGASATVLLTVVLQIMHYFAQRRRIHDPDSPVHLGGSHDLILPEFQISAGMAGGQKYATLVITQDGDVSGDIVNTAARLQARANRISPDRNKILVTSHIHQKLKNPQDLQDLQLLEKVGFLNTGAVDFKGTSLTVYDVILLPHEAHRLGHRDVMDELHEALEKGMWKSRVFESALNLASCLIENSPDLQMNAKKINLAPLHLRNLLNQKIRKSRKHFAEEEFELAVKDLAFVVDELAGLPNVDPVSMDHLRNIKANYQTLLGHFEAFLDKELDYNLEILMSPKEKENFLTMQKHHSMFGEVRENARLRIRNRKRIWYCIVEDNSDALKTSLQSPK